MAERRHHRRRHALSGWRHVAGRTRLATAAAPTSHRLVVVLLVHRGFVECPVDSGSDNRHLHDVGALPGHTTTDEAKRWSTARRGSGGARGRLDKARRQTKRGRRRR